MTRSAIPVQELIQAEDTDSEGQQQPPPTIDDTSDSGSTDFGIAPMGGEGVTGGFSELITEHSISIYHIKNGLAEGANADFKVRPILQNYPASLWGKQFVDPSSEVNGDILISNLISGYEIVPKEQVEPGESKRIPRQNPGFERYRVSNSHHWDDIPVYTADADLDDSERLQRMEETIAGTYKKRIALADYFGLDEFVESLDERPFDTNDYIGVPSIGNRPVLAA